MTEPANKKRNTTASTVAASTTNTKERKRKSGHHKTYKEALEEFAKEDPEFYKFLQEQEADLLECNDTDVVWESSSDDEDEDEDEKERQQQDGATMVAEGDHDREDDTTVAAAAGETAMAMGDGHLSVQMDKEGRKIVDNLAVLALREVFEGSAKPQPWAIRMAIKGFRSCVARVGANIETSDFVVNDNKVFDEMIRLCFRYLAAAIFEIMEPIKMEASKIDAKIGNKKEKKRSMAEKRFKKWKKWATTIKQYLQALVLFLNEIQNEDVIISTLRAIAEIVELYVYFGRLCRNLIKSVVRIWSRKTLECRMASTIVLCKIVRIDKRLYANVLKGCYISYVSNARDVSAQNMELIIFMQKSFAEFVLIYPTISYPYAFIYIRQLAIHLRNAMITKQKELVQTVYNWQYINCLYLWANVISKIFQKYRKRNENENGEGEGERDWLCELVYPLSQITIATMKLFASSKYIPLQMHCIKILLILQYNCDVYIPTLSLSVQILNDFGLVLKKRPTKGKGSVKGIDMNCIIKASTSQLEDAGFREAILDELFKLQLESASLIKSSISFPDILYPIDNQMKEFCKNCRNINFTKLFKSLNQKLNEHAKWIDRILVGREMNLQNEYSLASLEGLLAVDDSPLGKFYGSWHQIWESQKQQSMRMDEIKKTVVIKSARDKAEEKNVIAKEEKEDNDDKAMEELKESKETKKKRRKKKGSKKDLTEKKADEQTMDIKDEIVDFVMSDLDD